MSVTSICIVGSVKAAMQAHAVTVLVVLVALSAIPIEPAMLTLTTNSTENCGKGLTHNGVFVLVEYRLIETQSSPWTLLQSISLNATGLPIIYTTVTLYLLFSLHNHTVGFTKSQTDIFVPLSNDTVQLRIVQPEHGGGSCNCWEVDELSFTSTNGSSLNIS